MDYPEASQEDAAARIEDAAASERVHWGRVVAGLVVGVLGVFPLIAGIAVFIWGLFVEEVCFWECNPVSTDARVFTSFVGVLLVTFGLVLLAGASQLLFRKSLLRLVAWWVPDQD